MSQQDDEDLVERALEGDNAALQKLFDKNRARLKKTISFRMDKRLAVRVDASDIVQEAFLEAVKRWPRYIKRKTMPFYLWLRWIARDKLIDLHRQHLGAGKRAMTREVPILPADRSASFALDLMAGTPTPSRNLARKELVDLVRRSLSVLDPEDRELVLSHDFEGLTIAEAAHGLLISEPAAQKRYTRALDRLRKKMFQLMDTPLPRAPS
jgi:RNA polymerase sigma-70 factor, ECF subfamily